VTRRIEVLRLLADGREHSGEALATALGVTRAAVWKQVQQLEQWGLESQAVAGRGYRLLQPVDLLDPAAVLAVLPSMVSDRMRRLVVLDEVDSTNDALLAVQDLPGGCFDACLAEFQTQGRGRRGRQWTAPFGSGLCISLSWRFAEAPPQLSALSLAAGVALLRTLGHFGVRGLGLKWPNDLLLNDEKLGGILCELRAESAGPAFVVIGIGLNVSLPQAARRSIEATGLRPAALDQCLEPSPGLRSSLAGVLLSQLVLVLAEFEQAGFQPFIEEWRAADSLCSRPVVLHHGGDATQGIARGIDADGALEVEIDGIIRRVVSGEVSVRTVA
jgi:BirA family biotin operon repressor/biotin-[acetyl-CoA-carboxylase] ligase